MRAQKAQAAMEFLMTYGWAILVVLIALAALFYLGVFSPRTPSTCNVAAPITCTDVKATGTTLTLVLAATGTSDAQLTSVNIASPAVTCTAQELPAAISTQSPTGIDVTCATMAPDAKLSGTGTVTYTLQGGTTHTTTVQFSGTVE